MKSCKLWIEIILTTNIDDYWTDWFEGLTLIQIDDGITKIFGEVSDQAALHGVIERIRDLNLKFSSIKVEER